MREFEIDIQRTGGAPPDTPVGIAIRSGDIVFTRLLRQGSNIPEDHIDASSSQLAFWLVDNWWRLVSECVPATGQSASWRLGHDLASMGGYAWPRLAIWGEGARIGLSSRSDPPGVVGPVRYLTDALTYVSAASFERSALTFAEQVASEGAHLASDWDALTSQLKVLNEERQSPDLTAWRRLEAQLGYDVDGAPEAVMMALVAFEQEYGFSAVAEAALASQGSGAAAILEAEIAVAESQHWQCDLTRTALLVGSVQEVPSVAPWELGERAAAKVRAMVGYPKGALSNSALGEVLAVRSAAFRSKDKNATARAYGLRLNTGRRRGEVVSLAASWSADRRFEFARALGDAIWTQGERLGPLTRAKSERQKFQRAFAQSLLCPYEDLISYIGDDVTDGALSAAARHFLVSEKVVRSLLVNKHDLSRRRLGQTFRSSTDIVDAPVTFEDAVEAA
ncbi:MAG: hypothetical protein Q7T23_05050 [Phenylobacterium sp.]|nr:hypothetical protein [Phenylobacterium sp.]